MKVFLLLALAVGPAIQALAADAPAIDEPDFTAGPLPASFKLARADSATIAKSTNHPELVPASTGIYTVVHDAKHCRIGIAVSRLKQSKDDEKKDFVNAIMRAPEKTFAKLGYKLVANDGPDAERADLSKPYIANMAFENEESKAKMFAVIRVTFSGDAQLSTAVSGNSKAEMQPLIDWVDSIKLK